MKLSQYAKREGIQYRSAWIRYKKGKIKGAYLDESGHIVVPDPVVENLSNCAIYARVSSSKQKDDLERQVERMVTYANSQGLTVVKIVREIASGVNDERPKLTKLLKQDDWGTIVVEHKDRLSRIGFNWFEILLKTQGKHILVANRAEESKTDLIEDFISIIYSFSARIYGKRSAKNKSNRIKEIINANND